MKYIKPQTNLNNQVNKDSNLSEEIIRLKKEYDYEAQINTNNGDIQSVYVHRYILDLDKIYYQNPEEFKNCTGKREFITITIKQALMELNLLI
jgi:hypothetical protein